MVDEALVREALSHVNDPHVPVSLEKMGMLRGIQIGSGGQVEVELGIPCLSCPGVSMLKEKITQAVMAVPGATSVTVREGWHHSWTADMIDNETQQYMRKYGVQV
jgi:ATP-binding protein involved in chromosome partitioning